MTLTLSTMHALSIHSQVRNRDRIARLATKHADAMTTAFCATVESEHPVGRLRCGRKLFLHTQQETAMCTILALQGCA